jgi:hypothetical protein
VFSTFDPILKVGPSAAWGVRHDQPTDTYTPGDPGPLDIEHDTPAFLPAIAHLDDAATKAGSLTWSSRSARTQPTIERRPL